MSVWQFIQAHVSAECESHRAIQGKCKRPMTARYVCQATPSQRLQQPHRKRTTLLHLIYSSIFGTSLNSFSAVQFSAHCLFCYTHCCSIPCSLGRDYNPAADVDMDSCGHRGRVVIPVTHFSNPGRGRMWSWRIVVWCLKDQKWIKAIKQIPRTALHMTTDGKSHTWT